MDFSRRAGTTPMRGSALNQSSSGGDPNLPGVRSPPPRQRTTARPGPPVVSFESPKPQRQSVLTQTDLLSGMIVDSRQRGVLKVLYPSSSAGQLGGHRGGGSNGQQMMNATISATDLPPKVYFRVLFEDRALQFKLALDVQLIVLFSKIHARGVDYLWHDVRLDPWLRPVDYDMHPGEANTVSLRIVRGDKNSKAITSERNGNESIAESASIALPNSAMESIAAGLTTHFEELLAHDMVRSMRHELRLQRRRNDELVDEVDELHQVVEAITTQVSDLRLQHDVAIQEEQRKAVAIDVDRRKMFDAVSALEMEIDSMRRVHANSTDELKRQHAAEMDALRQAYALQRVTDATVGTSQGVGRDAVSGGVGEATLQKRGLAGGGRGVVTHITATPPTSRRASSASEATGPSVNSRRSPADEGASVPPVHRDVQRAESSREAAVLLTRNTMSAGGSLSSAPYSSRRRAAQGYQALGFLDDDDVTADGCAKGASGAAPSWLPAAAFTGGGGTHRVHDERQIASPGESTGAVVAAPSVSPPSTMGDQSSPLRDDPATIDQYSNAANDRGEELRDVAEEARYDYSASGTERTVDGGLAIHVRVVYADEKSQIERVAGVFTVSHLMTLQALLRLAHTRCASWLPVPQTLMCCVQSAGGELTVVNLHDRGDCLRRVRDGDTVYLAELDRRSMSSRSPHRAQLPPGRGTLSPQRMQPTRDTGFSGVEALSPDML